jgi:hypothetical protein
MLKWHAKIAYPVGFLNSPYDIYVWLLEPSAFNLEILGKESNKSGHYREND